MTAMITMEIWVNIVEISQGYEGVSSSRDSGVCRGSVNISRAGIQLVGKGDIEEEIEYNISCQEN